MTRRGHLAQTEEESSLPANEGRGEPRPPAPALEEETSLLSEENGSPSPMMGLLEEEPVAPGPNLYVPAEPPAGLMVVRCVGNFQLVRDGRVVQKGLRSSSRELLAYLVAYRQGVPKDRILEYL
ncbi:MAG: hypothetical protein ACRDJ4_07535 [Actinomycetota bacterium]